MGASPVRTRVVRKLFAIWYSVSVVTVFTFTHWFPSRGSERQQSCKTFVASVLIRSMPQ